MHLVRQHKKKDYQNHVSTFCTIDVNILFVATVM